MTHKYVIGIAVILAGFLLLGLLDGITGNVTKETPLIITFPAMADFLSEDQGSVTFDFTFPDASFSVGDKKADFLLFLDSAVVPGVRIGYSPKEQKLYAGRPQLISPEMQLIDGRKHLVTYLFDKSTGMQALFVDGTLMAEGAFSEKASLTGYAIVQQATYSESFLPLSAEFE